MPPYRDVLAPDSGLFETCARHTSRHTSRLVQHLYLCDPCAIRLVREGLNNRPPIYHGETVAGFCGLCNQRTEVTLRMWFACGPCWNVVIAYQKSYEATRAIHDYWRTEIEARYPTFRLQESEEVRLSPYARQTKTKKQAAATLGVLDFLVTEARGARAVPIFHVEQKSGPSSIEGMSEFQLDVNDSNDIAGVVNLTKLPAYIFHVQLTFEYHPPTRRTVANGLWWTDVLALEANRKSVKARRGEDKLAGYYKTGAFRPIATFHEELATRRFEELARKIAAVGSITLL